MTPRIIKLAKFNSFAIYFGVFAVTWVTLALIGSMMIKSLPHILLNISYLAFNGFMLFVNVKRIYFSYEPVSIRNRNKMFNDHVEISKEGNHIETNFRSIESAISSLLDSKYVIMNKTEGFEVVSTDDLQTYAIFDFQKNLFQVNGINYVMSSRKDFEKSIIFIDKELKKET